MPLCDRLLRGGTGVTLSWRYAAKTAASLVAHWEDHCAPRQGKRNQRRLPMPRFCMLILYGGRWRSAVLVPACRGQWSQCLILLELTRRHRQLNDNSLREGKHQSTTIEKVPSTLTKQNTNVTAVVHIADVCGDALSKKISRYLHHRK